jgi:tRNA(Ile)-lysidine synthase
VGRALIGEVAAALARAGVAPGDGVVVAVSGGVDSMVLLHLLTRLRGRLRLTLHVVHVHHGLRGASAEREAACVAEAAAAAGAPCRVERLQPTERGPGVSVQVWGREARYRLLEGARREAGAGWIATGHTRNDQAETLLLNLVRGTGPRGLAGIPEVRGPIVRPLLTVSRDAIAAYAARWGVASREDPSNARDVYRRNRIRHRLLPLLACEYNPRIVEALAGLATQMREDAEALEAGARRLAGRALCAKHGAVGVRVAALAHAPPALGRRLFVEAFRRMTQGAHGLTRRHLAALLAVAGGAGEVRLPGGISASRAGEIVWLGPSRPRREAVGRPAQEAAEVSVPVGVWTRWEPGSCSIRLRRVDATRLRPGRGPACRELLGPAVLALPLCVRAWRPGDRFRPLGMAGAKKLQDFFVDSRIPREARSRIPLLVVEDRIAWVVGHRIAEPFRWRGEPIACLAEVRYGGRSA